MISSISRRSMISLLVLGAVTGFLGSLYGAKPALAQDRPVTAGEVVDRETLKNFVEGAKTHIKSIYESGSALAPFLNSTREEGDWKHGNTFLMLLLLDGTVLFHAGDVSAGGKNLFELEDDTGKTVVRDLIETGRLGGGHVDYTWDDPNDDEDDPAKVAYATSFFGRNYGNQVILAGGFYQDVSQIAPPVYDATLIPEPEVTAAEVVDRETLKKFVIGAMRGYIGALQEHGTDRYNAILDVFRIEDGHWRHGSIYLFILNDDGYVIFHGADRTQEARNRSHLEDINGVRFIQEFIRVARAGGGFVEYQYDDPSVPGDEVTGTPKLSYVQSFEARSGRRVIFGAGIYFDPSDYDRETMLAVDPSVLTEGGGPQTVTVTATQTGDLLPVTTRLPLTLSGTATGNDYTVTGDMHILIPPEGSTGTTELAFTVVNDEVEEPGGETIVVSAGYDQQELATAEIAINDLRPVLAGEVVDRETLKGFVEMVADSLERVTDANDFPTLAISFRTPGDWKHEDLYLSVVTVTGEMFFHGDDRTRDGIDISGLKDDNGEKVVQKILAAAGSGGGFVEFTWDDPNDPDDDPHRLAYATRYASGFGVGEFVLVGGFNMDIPNPETETRLPDPPAVQAQDVVDKETLKAFVQGSIRWSFEAFETYGVEAGALTSAWREEGGPFREGAIYLFILTTEGLVFFHGADVTQEGAIRTDLEDLNGKRFVEDLINVAVAGGGYVEYYFDDPSVEGDEELGSPKVSYAETIAYPEFFPGQTFVIGAGFYRRPVDDIPEITLEVSREYLVEGDEGQEVTVTATLTEAPVPVATIIDLTLEGTATGDDYTSEGTLEIIIPGDATSASTTLTFNVIDDEADEEETIVVKAGYEGQEIGTATITVLDVLVPPLPVGEVTAAEVMDRADRATLKTFVQAARAAYKGAIDEVGFDHHGEVVEAFRVEDGSWRLGEIYIFILLTNGEIFFHGANQALETVNLYDHQDLNGIYYTRDLISAAQAGGGFVEYYFDNPAVAGDEEQGSPKVGYTESVVVDGTELVIGSGFYFDLTGYVPEVTLSINPATVSEEGGAQAVTVTATQTSRAIPVATMIPLALSGTATGDDYSVGGNLSITIPGERTEGSTQLTFTVVNDDVYESGGESIIVTASFDDRDLDTATVVVTDSYDAPSAVGAPRAVTLEAGESRTIDAGALFSGTDLSFSAASSDNGVAEAVISAATLTITGVHKGSATVTVAARNAAGTATVEVGVTVTAIAAERMAYENILGAMGRNLLSSVSATIGGRFTAGTGGNAITVGGRRIDGLASSVTALANLTGRGHKGPEKHLALLNEAGYRRSAGGDYLLRTSSFSYALEDHAATEGLRWTVWGAGDLRNFQGEPDVDASYDGSLKTAYLGFDVAVQRNWLAGVALSHATGQSDYDVAVASGSLESRLTSVLPYLRWLCSTGLSEAWSIVGLGTGEAEVDDATADLSMRMAMMGIRTRLAGTGRAGLDLVGDAGLVRLSTSGSESPALGDINADAQRVRIGLEGSRSAKLAGGTTITPYAQFAGRYDGGAGQTGQGLEVTGGLRLSGGRVAVNAQGRFLAVHTAEGYSENGFSLIASLSPGAGGTGLSMSVAPRVGAGTGDSGMMWRDRPLAGTSIGGRSNARALRAEVGYGLAYPSMGVLTTPFGEMHLVGDGRRQMRLGARFGTADATGGGASLEFSGMRADRHGTASEHRIGLLARMLF